LSKIHYYRVLKGHGYWCPTPTMKAAGFENIKCGPDGPDAHAIAATWNERWQEVRRARKGKAGREAIATGGFVYFLRFGDRLKIGYSRTPLARTNYLLTVVPGKLDTCLIVAGSRQDEKRLHQRFNAYRQNGEWFVASKPILLTMMRSAMAGSVVHDGDDKAASGTETAQKVDTTAVSAVETLEAESC